jgi:ubiquinone/menaquinone biosynthesis C-methylase UbiE
MRSQDYADLYQLEDTFWWFSGMRRITAALLDPIFQSSGSVSVLDVGCGTGGMISWLSGYRRLASVTGLDVNAEALGYCRRRNHGQVTLGSAMHLPFRSSSFDLVTSFDVLVQLRGQESVRATLAEMFRVLRPGGIAFVRVAAYNWMRSSHDEAIDMQRRYMLKELSDKMEEAGFKVLRRSYANMFLLPVAIVWRRVLQPLGLSQGGSDVKPLPRSLTWLNGLLATVLGGEAFLLKHFEKLPFGLSAICIVTKPGEVKTG